MKSKQTLNRYIEQTEDLATKFFKKIRLEKVYNFTEKYLGKIDRHNKLRVETVYLLGTISFPLGLITNDPNCYVIGGYTYLMGLLHHAQIALNIKNRQKHIQQINPSSHPEQYDPASERQNTLSKDLCKEQLMVRPYTMNQS